jgi:hypothetical protein
MVMPALLWVAFWSSLMGAAACWGEAGRPVRVQTSKKPNERSDLSNGD